MRKNHNFSAKSMEDWHAFLTPYSDYSLNLFSSILLFTLLRQASLCTHYIIFYFTLKYEFKKIDFLSFAFQNGIPYKIEAVSNDNDIENSLQNAMLIP